MKKVEKKLEIRLTYLNVKCIYNEEDEERAECEEVVNECCAEPVFRKRVLLNW